MRHLTLKEIPTIHDLMIAQYGGTPGERDPEGLESALAQPSAEYFGVPLHPTPADQAAAYLFHLCQAHAFLDGNKRTAIFAMLTFLHLNNFKLTASNDDLFDLVVGVAKGDLDKPAISLKLEAWLKPS
jgi:death on curing protein